LLKEQTPRGNHKHNQKTSIARGGFFRSGPPYLDFVEVVSCSTQSTCAVPLAASVLLAVLRLGAFEPRAVVKRVVAVGPAQKS
jgi:hypothetical protein